MSPPPVVRQSTQRYIEDPEQLAALSSPMRQEICNAVLALGEASTVEIARELGVPADTLYYHVRRLVECGLLRERGIRPTARRGEAVYGLAVPELKVRYGLDDSRVAKRVKGIAAAATRAARNDFDRGFRPDLAVTEGDRRNLWAARHRAWLADADLHEANELLSRLGEIFSRSGTPGDGTLCSLTWVLAPLEPRPVRR